MKKIPSFLALVGLLISTSAIAQSADSKPYTLVSLGRLMPTVVDGKSQGIATTRAELLANTHLMFRRDGCIVDGFTFSLLPKGGDLKGPFMAAGAELTDKMKQLIKENKGKVFIEDITVKCDKGGGVATPVIKATPIVLSYTD